MRMKLEIIGLVVLTSCSMLADYRLVPPTLDVPYGPLPVLAPVGMSFTNGVMMKEGRPHFWIGNGDGDASSQQGHHGIWLAWLQGADAVTLNHGMVVTAKRAEDGVVEIGDRSDLGIQSWRREAVRLGLLCNFFHSHEPGTGGQTLTAEAYKLSLEDPALHEIYYHLGHHLGFDTGSDEGLALSLNHRKALFGYLKNEPYTAYMEIAREAGANPNNQRVLKAFRAWAQQKYGGDLAAADAIWGVTHASWEDVIPPHLDKARFPAKKSYEDYLMRFRAREEAPNFYADWFLFLQGDTTRMLTRELEALRVQAPWAPITVDVRGHTSRDDAYAALLPEALSPHVDLFSIHYGTSSFVYNNRPWDRASVLTATAAPLMWQSYFRNNTDGALVNSENIFGNARQPVGDEARMRENDLGQLCVQKWRIAKDDGSRKGLGRSMNPDFDDSSWDEISVPGCWDLARGTPYEGYRGTCWLRRTFTISGKRKQDFVDGSCTFKLIGKGVAQQGDVWLNGHRLNARKVQGWSTSYEFDVGALLNWGGRNVLVWRVEGCNKSDNGLRFPSYILTDDQLSKPVPFNERMCRLMSFSHLMEGLSGIWMWHWHCDGVRTYQPKLKAQLNAVAEAALPALRNRRSRVAYLFAYNNGRGLPMGGDARNYVDYFDAFTFAGEMPDVYGEERFRREVTPEKYPLLVVPMTPCVEPATYAHFKDYVAKGGTAIITEDSFRTTITRFAPTDLADYLRAGDFGKGKVVVFSSKAQLTDLMAQVKAYLPMPQMEVTAATSGELPLIERILAGDADRKVVYFANWGGMDQRLTVRLPSALADWRVTDVVGRFAREASGRFSVQVPAQDVVAAILTRPGASVLPVPTVSSRRQALLDELADKLARAHAVPLEKADVVFVGAKERPRGGRTQGIEKYPEILRALELMGLTYAEVSIEGLAPEHLATAKLVLVPESNSNAGMRNQIKGKGQLVGILRDYIKRGGSVMALVDSAKTRNCDALLLRDFAATFAVTRGSELARDEARATFGDPHQILSDQVPASPLSKGVKSVQLYTLTPLVFKGRSQKAKEGIHSFPVVTVPGGAAIVAGTCGKGRYFLSSDISIFAPLRIERGDNVTLLLNALEWLVRRPLTAEQRAQFAANRFLSENDFKAIREEESRE